MKAMIIPMSLLIHCCATIAGGQPTATGAKKFFDPVEQEIEGWPVLVDPQLLEGEHQALGQRALKALANHLQRVTYIVPEDRLEELKKLSIWIELEHAELKSMQYHPSPRWLKRRQYDPRLTKKVHIPRAKALVAPHMWAKHPYVVLHELAHSYHDQVLGFDEPRIMEAYERAKTSGSYDRVVQFNGKMVKHYGMNDHKEYFAEATEAYFGVNDFYPFVRAELQQHDPTMFTLLEEIWGKIR